jgi:hypothetical protein
MKVGIEVKFNPNFTRKITGELGKFVEDVMDSFVDIAYDKTPKATGAAARAWHTQGSRLNTTAVNLKPYIERLDNNWSKQTRGRGILKPTIQAIKRKYR